MLQFTTIMVRLCNFKIFTLQKSQNSMFLLICQISWFEQLKLYDDAIFKIFRFAEITKFYVFTHLTNFMICALSNCKILQFFKFSLCRNLKIQSFLFFDNFDDLYNNKIMQFYATLLCSLSLYKSLITFKTSKKLCENTSLIIV